MIVEVPQENSSRSVSRGGGPRCHYHPNIDIQYFCVKKECTVPLCEECLLIHHREHVQNTRMALQGIIKFKQAKRQALVALAQRAAEINEIRIRFDQQILHFRSKAIELIDQNIHKLREKILMQDKCISILAQIEAKKESIESGSLKELIEYFEQASGNKEQKLFSTYTGGALVVLPRPPNKETLSQFVANAFSNQKVNNDSSLDLRIKNVRKLLQKPVSLTNKEQPPNLFDKQYCNPSRARSRKGLTLAKSPASLSNLLRAGSGRPSKESDKIDWRKFVSMDKSRSQSRGRIPNQNSSIQQMSPLNSVLKEKAHSVLVPSQPIYTQKVPTGPFSSNNLQSFLRTRSPPARYE